MLIIKGDIAMQISVRCLLILILMDFVLNNNLKKRIKVEIEKSA